MRWGNKSFAVSLSPMHALFQSFIDITVASINWSPPGQNGHHFADDIFQMYFREWKRLYFESISIWVCSLESDKHYLSIGLDNGLAPNRRQTIIWTNADPIHWRIHAALGGDELRFRVKCMLWFKFMPTNWIDKGWLVMFFPSVGLWMLRHTLRFADASKTIRPQTFLGIGQRSMIWTDVKIVNWSFWN